MDYIFFRVASYLPNRHYLFVTEWIKKNVPAERKNNFFFVNDYNSTKGNKNIMNAYQLSTIQLLANIGYPEPPFIYMYLYSDNVADVPYERLKKIQGKFPLTSFLQKHNTSVYYKAYGKHLGDIKYENLRLTESDLFIRKMTGNKNIYPCTLPLLYSIENFHEMLFMVCADSSESPRPMTLEYHGFPDYHSEINNINRMDRNGNLCLSRKTLQPETEKFIRKSNNLLFYTAMFSEPEDISDIDIFFKNKPSAVRWKVEYKSKASVWHVSGSGNLNIGEQHIGKIRLDKEACELFENYKKLYMAEDSLSKIGIFHFDKRHTMLNFPSYFLPDIIKDVKELKIVLANEKDDGSIDMLRTKILSAKGYEKEGFYTSLPIDIRPYRYGMSKKRLLISEMDAEVPLGAGIRLLIRFSDDCKKWSEWYEVLSEKELKKNMPIKTVDFLQYKIILIRDNGEKRR